jgi:hypothetical protein
METYSIPDENHLAVSQGSEERILYNLKKLHNIDLALIFHGSPNFFFCPTLEADSGIKKDSWWKYNSKTLFRRFPYVTKDRPKDMFNYELIDIDSYRTTYQSFIENFNTPDLNHNRFYGALMQIDQYVTAKNIPTIHFTIKNTIPPWFKFTSGIVDTEISEYQNSGPFKGSYQYSPNAITEEGNKVIYDKLTNYISQLGF